MGRYDRNKKKKSDRSTFFIMPLILAVLIGIGGSLFTLKFFYKKEKLDSLSTQIKDSSKHANAPAPPADEQRKQITKDITSLPAIDKEIAKLNELIFEPQPGLPNLLDSDTLIRKQLTKLSPGLSPWLDTDQLIRRYLMIVNDFAQGIRVSKHMSFLIYEEPFSVLGDGNVLYIAPKSYRRYDSLAQAVQAIDAKAAVKLYVYVRPLILQVFGEFNYPKDITLESIISKAAGEIIATPVIEDQIQLVRPSRFYKFADPGFETLNPVQKQMIRMGPDNLKIFQMKCREFLVQLAKYK
jgi:Protein of unknown function (DUF3014)